MDSESNLPVKWSVTIDAMLDFDGILVEESGERIDKLYQYRLTTLLFKNFG